MRRTQQSTRGMAVAIEERSGWNEEREAEGEGGTPFFDLPIFLVSHLIPMGPVQPTGTQ